MKPLIQQHEMTVVENKKNIEVINNIEIKNFTKKRYPNYQLTKRSNNDGSYCTSDYFTDNPIILKEKDSVILDFGNHYVGYLSFKVSSIGSPQDAPVRLKLKMGEVFSEMEENFDNVTGWISNSWLQEELLFIDETPEIIKLKRRYSFRYLKIDVEAISDKYKVCIDSISLESTTSADSSVPQSYNLNEPFQIIDSVSMKTLEDCMQEVFEDGPKRDRRLWLGDLRLQALANYETFKNNDLVKKCLYLFAAKTKEDQEISACVFVTPEIKPDDTFFIDYSLIFIVTLWEYYEATGDLETLKDLWDIAYNQIVINKNKLNQDYLVNEDSWESGFIDWNSDINKQAALQGVFIFTLNFAQKIATELEDNVRSKEIELLSEKMKEGALNKLYDVEKGYFVSGDNRQVSYASQVWLVLGGVLDKESARELLHNLTDVKGIIPMNTPYMHHYFVEALYSVGDIEGVLNHIEYYWGGMIREGADTFWEVYSPEGFESPYGSKSLLSYCHAWSCTPSYFLRKIFRDKVTV